LDRKNIKVIFILIAILLLFTGCQQGLTEKPENKPPKPFSIKELSLDWIDPQASIEDLEREQKYREKEISDDETYLTYRMEHCQYVFAADEEYWEKNIAHTLLYVEIFSDDGGNLPGPRKIQIGDDFDSVLKKFPQERNWQEDAGGIFYGAYTSENLSEMELGSVSLSSDGTIGFITLVPKGHPPFIKIHFNENAVSTIIIYYQIVF